MKILATLLILFSLSSCETPSLAKQEADKTLKQKSASERINSTNSNSNDLFKEMDQ